MSTVLTAIIKTVVIIYGVTFGLLILSVLTNLSIYLENKSKSIIENVTRK